MIIYIKSYFLSDSIMKYPKYVLGAGNNENYTYCFKRTPLTS